MKKEQRRCCDFRARLGRGRFHTKEWDVSHDAKKARNAYTREKNFFYSKSGYKRERVHVDSPSQKTIAKVGPESKPARLPPTHKSKQPQKSYYITTS